MIVFLNRGLILEQEIVKALKHYCSILDVPGYYRNFRVNITNQHPFAKMLLAEAPETEAASLFPAIIVATEEDSKPAELSSLVETSVFTVESEDIAEGADGSPSALERRYAMITPTMMRALREAMDAKEDKRIFGCSRFIRRRDHVSIELWAENPQLKNELYELVRLFVLGFLQDYLAAWYHGIFSEDGAELNLFTIFDHTVQGQRSNNFNVDFGVELCGGHIAFDADYIIEQSIIDTDIVDGDKALLEVINHVKGYEDVTQSWIGGKYEVNGADSAGGADGGGGSLAGA